MFQTRFGRLRRKDYELVGRQREFSVRLAFIVRELDLVGTIQEFQDSANLPAHETMRRRICEKSYDIQQAWSGVHCRRSRASDREFPDAIPRVLDEDQST